MSKVTKEPVLKISDLPLAKLEGRFFYVGVGPKSRCLDHSVAQEIIQGIVQADFSNGHPIIFVVTGPGGEVPSTFAIADCIGMCRSPTIAVATGEVCSGHAHVFMAAQKRYMTPTARLMFHSPTTIVKGSPEEIWNSAGNLARDRDVIAERLLSETKLTKKQVVDAMINEKYWTATESRRVGLCHGIIDSWAPIAKHINKGA